MRDLKKYPITLDEIVECLTRLADQLRGEAKEGDMRPLLLSEAAKIVGRNDN